LRNNFVTSRTIPVFLIGHPVSHSKSPLMQNAAFRKEKIKSVYLALDISPEKFDETIRGLKNLNIFGMNVTLPYKVDILKHLDRMSADAEAIGSVNTIEINDGKWIGHNTDWFGVYKSLEHFKINNTKKVFIIGAGGASNGLIFGLKKYGFKNITITNRTMSKAEELANKFSIKLSDYKNLLEDIKKNDFIINCTTLSFKELIGKLYDKEKIYYDLKYYNEKPNIKNYIDGSIMLIYQGAEAFRIWTKKEAPVAVMKKTFFKK
jgi:shikimate dehydrogenase